MQEKNITTDFIDACVWIEPYQTDVEKCSKYLNLIGYKSKNQKRNIGAITVPILGEIKIMIITKISSEDFKLEVSKNIIRIISKLRNTKSLRIYKFRNVNDKDLHELREVDYKVTEDDALHICSAINIGCQNFITTDKFLLGNNILKSWARKQKKLKIREPY